jgi:aspartate dehydrogenase
VRVGLIGLGAIGCGVLELLQPEDHIQVVGALVANPGRERRGSSPRVLGEVQQLLELQPEVVVEAAGHAALRCHGPAVLRAGVDLFIVSIGALADPDTQRDLAGAASTGRGQLTVISGAIGGLDAIAAAAVGGLTRVIHTTRKPARALLPIDEAHALTTEKELFRGSAREGALKFPESINVAAAVSLAGLGLDRTEVRVIADPALERNRHTVEVEGSFGELRFEIMNVPTEANPRTGRLVAMSVVHALRRRQAWLVLG